MYFYNKPSFLFFPSESCMSSVSLLHWKQHFCFTESFQHSASMPTSLVWRGYISSSTKAHPLLQTFSPVFEDTLVSESLDLSQANSRAICPSTPEQQGSSLSLHIISFLKALADEPWQISWNVTALVCCSTRCRGKMCVQNSVSPVHSLPRCI